MAGKGKRGRHSFLAMRVTADTGELVPIADAMCARIRIGVSLRGACEAFGISYSTLFGALSKGNRDAAVGKLTQFAQLADQIARARADCRAHYAKLITAAAQTDWRAAAWMLERQFHEEYGEKRYAETATLGAPQIVIQLPGWASTEKQLTSSQLRFGEALEGKAISIHDDVKGAVK